MANWLAQMQYNYPDPIGVDVQKRKNALAEREMAVQEQNALAYRDQLGMQQQGRQMQMDEAQKARVRDWAIKGIEVLSSAKSEQEFASIADAIAGSPEAREIGLTRDQITPESVSALRAQLGAGPSAQPYQVQLQAGPHGSTIVHDGQRFSVVEPPKPQAAGSFRALTPQEVQQVGLPAGTAAQIGPDGKIEVLSKRDNTGVLSQKDQTTAKMKLTTVRLAKAQLAKIKEAFVEGRKGILPNAFGPGQGLAPTPAGKMFDARVNQMRSTLTALTRVPGVGAMSDYETKLDQAKFPERNTWESVTEDQIRGLEDQLALIEAGYTDLLSGNPQEQSAPAEPDVVDWDSL